MGRRKPSWRKATPLLLTAAVGLLAASAAGSSRAALTYYSENYTAQIEMYDIGVTLVENGRDVSWRNYTQKDDAWSEHKGELLTDMEESLQPGKAYPERLCVRNSGNIDIYVRVFLYCYWEDGEGKRTDLSPDLIRLNLTGNGWVEGEESHSGERRVLYYTSILPAGENSVTPDFTDTLTIDESVGSFLAKAGKTETVEGSPERGAYSIRTDYEYDGLRFVIEAEVDAVQTHNGADAMRSAWGDVAAPLAGDPGADR